MAKKLLLISLLLSTLDGKETSPSVGNSDTYVSSVKALNNASIKTYPRIQASRSVRSRQLNFDTLALLEKKENLKVNQRKINNTSSASEAKKKNEVKERGERDRQNSASSSKRGYVSWKVAYKFDSSGGNTSKIECSNGQQGFAQYYYNDKDYYVGGVFNSTLEDAANYICGNL